MATQTPNHKLTKPEMTDKADISMINPNWDTLDTALKAVEDRVESTATTVGEMHVTQPYTGTMADLFNSMPNGSTRVIYNYAASTDNGHPMDSATGYWVATVTRMTAAYGQCVFTTRYRAWVGGWSGTAFAWKEIP